MTLFSDIADLFSTVGLHWKGLTRVSLLWFVLMVIFISQAGPTSLDPMASSQNFMGVIFSTIAVLALLSGWFAIHRHFMNPDNAQIYPTGPQVRFVGTQVGVMTLIIGIAGSIISPLAAYEQLKGVNMMTLTQDWKPPPTPEWVMPAFLILMMVVFARLLLSAPMSARGEPKAIRRSWRATRGHFFRIFLLQFIALVPSGAGMWLQEQGGGLAGAAGAVALDFFSLWLLAALAEAEYAKLGSKAPLPAE